MLLREQAHGMRMVCAVESEKRANGGTEEVVLSCEFWVLSYPSRARAKETRGTKETRQTRETRYERRYKRMANET
jgi:hypothetical protein